jgi:poly(3-hydroxybutyrate) depolymerase
LPNVVCAQSCSDARLARSRQYENERQIEGSGGTTRCQLDLDGSERRAMRAEDAVMKQLCFAIGLGGVLLGGCSSSEDPSGGVGTSGTAGSAAGGVVGQAGAGSSAGGVSGHSAVAGSASQAGAGGAPAGGAAGMSGAAGSGGAGGGPDNSLKPSAGCTKPANQALDEWVRYTLTAKEIEREYFVRLPEGYDPLKPYRLMFTFPGCTGKGDGAVPLFNAPGADAIFVGPSPDGDCFVYGLDSKDVAFFDEMLKVVEANYCVDQNRIFTSGHSSGSWLSNVLGCQRSNILRAQGNISGALPGLDMSKCLTQSIAGMLIHDQDDPENDVAGGIEARDRLLKLNGCGTETKPIAPEPCVAYQGGKTGYPVIWCQTQGEGHSRQDSLTVPALYDFFARF